MKSITLLSYLVTVTSIHVGATNATHNDRCSSKTDGKSFCDGLSLLTSIIIHCRNGKSESENCSDNLAKIPPIGVKPFAPCYQASPTADDAVCSFNGIAYPENGISYNISTGPGLGLLSAVATAASGTAVVISIAKTITPMPVFTKSTEPSESTESNEPMESNESMEPSETTECTATAQVTTTETEFPTMTSTLLVSQTGPVKFSGSTVTEGRSAVASPSPTVSTSVAPFQGAGVVGRSVADAAVLGAVGAWVLLL